MHARLQPNHLSTYFLCFWMPQDPKSAPAPSTAAVQEEVHVSAEATNQDHAAPPTKEDKAVSFTKQPATSKKEHKPAWAMSTDEATTCEEAEEEELLNFVGQLDYDAYVAVSGPMPSNCATSGRPLAAFRSPVVRRGIHFSTGRQVQVECSVYGNQLARYTSQGLPCSCTHWDMSLNQWTGSHANGVECQIRQNKPQDTHTQPKHLMMHSVEFIETSLVILVELVR